MRYCGSTHTDTRNRAAALLCVLARENQRRVGHIARVKLQATIAVSKLVRRGMERASSDLSFELLQSSLREAARALTATDRALGAELTALAERSVQVLRDSQRIAEFRWDPETTADLYYDIARGYSDAPDLRVVWLANLAKFHAERQQSVEAANANLVAAALVARCLRALGRDEAGCVPQQFGSVYANAKHEHMAPTRRALAALGNETCRSGAFSEGGVVNLLREAIALFGAEQLHEARMACYHLLLPVYEARGNYLARGICHRNLQELCEAIAAARAAGREQRLFANYYRVAFFGRAFGALDGGEFVYREPPSVRLADFTERLQRQFGGKFEVPGGKVALLKNARERVDAAARDPAQPAMQVVSLEPHFEREDAARRGTSYERAVNLSQFVFQTPFTVDNKAHGDVASQHILRSVVRTDVPLPSTRKRVRIVERRDAVLTPIEVGAEMIESKSNLLRRELGEREIAFDEADAGDEEQRGARRRRGGGGVPRRRRGRRHGDVGVGERRDRRHQVAADAAAGRAAAAGQRRVRSRCFARFWRRRRWQFDAAARGAPATRDDALLAPAGARRGTERSPRRRRAAADGAARRLAAVAQRTDTVHLAAASLRIESLSLSNGCQVGAMLNENDMTLSDCKSSESTRMCCKMHWNVTST
jgi:hypothetical protein